MASHTLVSRRGVAAQADGSAQSVATCPRPLPTTITAELHMQKGMAETSNTDCGARSTCFWPRNKMTAALTEHERGRSEQSLRAWWPRWVNRRSQIWDRKQQLKPATEKVPRAVWTHFWAGLADF